MYIDQRDDHVAPGETPAPGERDGREHREERHADEQCQRDLLGVALPLGAERACRCADDSSAAWSSGPSQVRGRHGGCHVIPRVGRRRQCGGYVFVTYATVGPSQVSRGTSWSRHRHRVARPVGPGRAAGRRLPGGIDPGSSSGRTATFGVADGGSTPPPGARSARLHRVGDDCRDVWVPEVAEGRVRSAGRSSPRTCHRARRDPPVRWPRVRRAPVMLGRSAASLGASASPYADTPYELYGK